MSDPLDYRSWGETQNCHGCRFWSEMLAKDDGAGILAMCIAPTGPRHGKYTGKHVTCDAWQEGSMGAVDTPGGDPYGDAVTALPAWFETGGMK